MTDDLFQRAAEISCPDIAGREVLLRRQGARLVGPCPACGGSTRSGRFQIDLRRNIWCCFACPPGSGQQVAGGDAVSLEQHLRGGNRRDAAMRLLGEVGGTDRRMPANERRSLGNAGADDRDRRREWSREIASEILRRSTSATGSCVEGWLRARGLDPGGLPDALACLRYHPRCPAGWESRGGALQVREAYPAMVAPIQTLRVRRWICIGVHVTYLRSRRGSVEKAGPGRRIFGRLRGGAVLLSPPAWMTDVSVGPLVVGEGLESTWAAATRIAVDAPGEIRAAATLSLDNLQGGWASDRRGCVDVSAPLADPARPPFLLPDAGRVVIAVDSDMASVRVRARHGDVTLDGLARARVCAALAAQHWRIAGADSVETRRPRGGWDPDDLAMAAMEATA